MPRSPRWRRATSRASALLCNSGLILEKHLSALKDSAVFQQDISEIAHHFIMHLLLQLPLKLSLPAALQEMLLTLIAERQNEQIRTATFCTSGVMGKG